VFTTGELITIVYPWGINIAIPLNDSSQGGHPFHCHKCWESNNRDSGAFDSPWSDCDRQMKMGSLGIHTISTNASYQNMRIANRLDELEGMINSHILEKVK
jgi:hypothetical protein